MAAGVALAVCARAAAARSPFAARKALERQLVLPEGRSVELRLHVGAECRICKRQGDCPGEPLRRGDGWGTGSGGRCERALGRRDGGIVAAGYHCSQ